MARFLRPGVNECEVEAEFAHEFIRQGGRFAYPPIIAAGANSCALHYHQNDQPCRRGDVLLLDVGAGYANYNADLTRTPPVGGRFTRRQKEVNRAVLRVLRASVAGAVVRKLHRDWQKEAKEMMGQELLALGLLKKADFKKQTLEKPARHKYFMLKRLSASLLRNFLAACACASGPMLTAAHAQRAEPGIAPQATAASGQVKTVFYIMLENRNFTAGTDISGGSVIFGNPAAPYLNSLITPGNGVSAQVSCCTAYHHVLATANGVNPSIHPSEPNYLWMEAGSNLGKANDNDPYGPSGTVQQILGYLAAHPAVSRQHLRGLLQEAGISWKSYQEDIDMQTTTGTNANLGGALTSAVAPSSLWTVPLASFSGSNAAYTNPYNGSHEWNFACKHDGALFFLDTNGSPATAADTSTTNPMVSHYAPLQQLTADLHNNAVARYNVITPDQYNNMHTALYHGFTYQGTHYLNDSAQVAQGDHFLSMIVPQIMASPAYRNNGAIVIWTDETEGTNQNDFNHTITEIVISPLAKGNAYHSTVNLTHSSDVATMQEIFQVKADTPTGYLNDAANRSNSAGALAGTAPGFGTSTAQDLSDLFVAGAIPSGLPGTRVSAAGDTGDRRDDTAARTVTAPTR